MSTDESVSATTDRGHYLRQQREQAIAKESRSRLEAACEAAHEALGANDYDRVAELLADVLLPALDATPRSLARLGTEVGPDRDWYPGDIRAVLAAFDEAEPGQAADSISNLSNRVIELGFRTAYAALAAKGRVRDDAQTVVPAYEYRHQVGERYYRALSGGGGTLEMADADDDRKATLLTGGQGSGKSATAFTLAEDRIASNHKVIDLIDLFKAENAMYDIASRNTDLNDIREQAGLSPGFRGDYDPPDQEILLPLTHELADAEVPYDTVGESFTAVPFTIPASDLTFRQLVMLLPHTTDTQEKYLRSAHQKLNNRRDEWTLRDVAEVVRKETNAGEGVKDRIKRSLETAQDKSFIRDEDSKFAVDWQGIMADRETVTSFSTYMIREKSDKLAITSWLLDSLYEARLELLRRHAIDEYPPLTVMMREVHKVAPRQKAEQDNEATIEGYMIDTFGELIALMRHVDMEIIADTQKFKKQLSPSVSGLFHRVFAFSGQKPDIRRVFRTRVDETDPAERVAQYPTGKCALVSGDGYRMPIQMYPPRLHHLNAKLDGDGLGARTTYLENEELRPAPWDSTVPPRLRFDDMDRGPLAEFIHQFVSETGSPDDYIPKQEFTELFNDWYVNVYGGSAGKDHSHLCRLIHQKAEWDDFEPKLDGKRVTCWKGIVVTYDPAGDEGLESENQ